MLPAQHWQRKSEADRTSPNSDSVGFQSLGPGGGATKMHALKNRNSPGTLLEPSWNLVGTFLEPCWNLACNLACNLAGTFLEQIELIHVG